MMRDNVNDSDGQCVKNGREEMNASETNNDNFVRVDFIIGFTPPQSTALPSWGLYIQFDGASAQITRHLCPQCDRHGLTPARAFLRALLASLRFAHTISRPYSQGDRVLPLSILLQSLSGHFVHKQVSPKHAHYLLKKHIIALQKCLLTNGCEVLCVQEKHKTHTGISYATHLATSVEKEGHQTMCITCDKKFQSVGELSSHFRSIHLKQTASAISLMSYKHDSA